MLLNLSLDQFENIHWANLPHPQPLSQGEGSSYTLAGIVAKDIKVFILWSK